ncbi:hypothetical protein TRFO_15176 [Tritrichomonas foetus]|uniref:Uncharacterized protein n=1 Tax=Tritrichomonas foetus TaxID=1144522 RepID=A0A1J4KTE4_9EUKA|nr:hypothetical protein TRFO_15176 [Tritrichomonas foetus]|eukprot:OHT14402.1 hypothetical protein TRFO_15176 [Tritrichomonas foetus]
MKLKYLFEYVYVRIKWGYTRFTSLHKIIWILFVAQLYILMDHLFWNSLVRYPMPVYTNVSNVNSYNWSESHWETISYEYKINPGNISILGRLEGIPAEIYKQEPFIADPEITHFYNCIILNNGLILFSFTEYPQSHAWFHVMNHVSPYLVNINFTHKAKTAIALPFTEKLGIPFFAINVLSLLYNFNKTLLHNYPVAISTRFEGFDEIINLAGFDDLNFIYIEEEGEWIDIEDAFITKISNPYEVNFYSINKFVKKVKKNLENDPPKPNENDKITIIQNSKNHENANQKKIVIFQDGDLRVKGKKSVIDAITNKFNGTIEMIPNDTNFTDIILSLQTADIVIGFSGPLTSMTPFMKEGATFIEFQRPMTISRSVLLARAFGFNVEVIVVRDTFIVQNVIDQTLEIIRKLLN